MKNVFLVCLIIMLSVSFVALRSYGQSFKENPRLIKSPNLHYGKITDKPASVTFIVFFTDDDDILTEENAAPCYDPSTGMWWFEDSNFGTPPNVGEMGYIWLYGSNGICYHDSNTATGAPIDWGNTPSSGSNIGPPGNLTATPGPPGTITLNWTPANGATNYTIYRSITSDGAYETRVAEGITATTYADTGLSNQEYTYIVVGKDDLGNLGGHSNVANANVLLYGDVSGDGNITAYDASLVFQCIVGLIELSPEAQDAADVTGNDTVTSLDAALILQYCVGLITEFPRK